MFRRRRDEDGASAVEFGLVVIPFLVLTLGMIQYGWYFYVSQTTGGAANSVARRLQVGDCWTATEAFDYAKQQSSWVTAVNKTPNDLSSAVVGTTQITVEVVSDGRIIGLIPMPDNGIVTRTVKAQLEDLTPGAACP